MICDKIKEICDKKGITIAELERNAGLSKGAIYKWRESSPTLSKLQAVADVLGVKVSKLID